MAIKISGTTVIDDSQGLRITGISTFTNGPVLVGSATSTGTASQRLQVTGGAYVSGNLGVGVTNPASNTQVAIAGTLGIGEVGSSGSRTLISSSGGGFNLNHNDNSNITIQVEGSNRLAYQYSSNSWVIPATGISLVIGTGATTGTTSQPLQVTGGAYVSTRLGIAQTNPNTALHIGPYNGNTLPHLYLASGNNLFGWRIDTQDFGGGSVPLRIWRRVNGTDTESITVLNQNGNVGIATTNPSSTLSVGGTITELYAGQYWNLVSQADIGIGASQVPLNQYLGQLAFLDAYSPSGLRRDGGGADDLVIDSIGEVGIGTTAPTSVLHVVGGDSRFGGVIETVSTATTYMSGSAMVLEMDVRQATTYTYTMPTGANVGIVSFRNMPAQTNRASGTTITCIFTQPSTITAGTGNTTATTGIGTNCTVVGYENGAAVAGISTRALVGAATTVTLSSTGSDRDFVSFFIHYTGGTNTVASSYQVYATSNGNFRRGSVGV